MRKTSEAKNLRYLNNESPNLKDFSSVRSADPP